MLLESTIKPHNFYSKGQKPLDRCTQHGMSLDEIRFLTYSSLGAFHSRGHDFCLNRDMYSRTGFNFSHFSRLKWQKRKQQGDETPRWVSLGKKTMKWKNCHWKWQKSRWIISPNTTLNNFPEGRLWQIQYCINPGVAIEKFQEGLDYLKRS